MIGVFDSGKGGLNLLYELRKIRPYADVAFLADRKNAPYGTKSKEELIRLIEQNVRRLVGVGANKILMACCTASTVFEYLPEKTKSICVPIIAPSAKEAALITKNGKIGVIATRATVTSSAFSNALRSCPSVKEVYESPLQELVALIESGVQDGRINDYQRKKLRRMLSPIKESGIDTLILGCTHFPLLKREIICALPGVRIVSSAKEGAMEMLKYTSDRGKAQTLYL